MRFLPSLISRSVDWRTPIMCMLSIFTVYRKIPEDMTLQLCRCENFDGYNVLFVCHMTGALMIT